MSDPNAPVSALPSRRQVMLAGGAVVICGCTWGSSDAPTEPKPTEPSLLPAQEVALRAALLRLLPGSEKLPDAEEAKVAAYVLKALANPALPGLKDTIAEGLDELDKAAQRDGQAPFAKLTIEAQETLLTLFQTGDPATRFRTAMWFELLLTLALEGYLGHPRHGGNPGGMVWKALGNGWAP